MKAAVDIATPQQIVAHLTACANNRSGCSVVGISAPYATAMADDAALRDAFLQADLLIPDGKGFAWGCKLLGVPVGERLAIPDLCELLLVEGNTRGWKVFIYGATEEVNAKACANVARRFPGLACVAGEHGYGQGQTEEDAVIERLKNEAFNLLIVARPSPDKEKFLARCCRTSGVVGLAAGGYADILAGLTSRAPALVQGAGLEWLYRVLQEPRRLWKRIGWANARFAAATLWAHLRMPPSRPWWGCPAVHVAAILLAVTAAYATSLNNPYHFDDPEYIQDNPTIRSFDRLRDIKVASFRKLWWLSNAVCYRLSELYGNHQADRPDVRIFRAWNIACHLVAALALFGLLRRSLRASGHVPDIKEPGCLGGSGTPYDLAAAAAAAIFAAHPLCTESVTYISGRDNSQGGMFYLLGLYAAAIAFERMGLSKASESAAAPSSGTPEPLRWPRWFWPAVCALLLGAAAIFTKESHLTYPGAVALVYAVFFRGTQPHRISVGLLLGTLAAMALLAWGAAGRRLDIAFQWMLLLIAGGAILGASPAQPESSVQGPRWRRFLQRRISLNWAFAATIAGLGVASIAAFPYAYQRTMEALTGSWGSNYVRSLCSQAYAVPWMLLRAVAPYGLNIDHDFPSLSEPGKPLVILGAALIYVFVAAVILGLLKRERSRTALVLIPSLSGAVALSFCLIYVIPDLSWWPTSLRDPRWFCVTALLALGVVAFRVRCLGKCSFIMLPGGAALAYVVFQYLPPPPFVALGEIRVVGGTAVILTLLIFGVVGIWKRWLGAFGVLLALLSIAPSNSVIERGDIVSERNFYLAAAGGACMLAWLLATVLTWFTERAAKRAAGTPDERTARTSALLEAGLWTGVLGCCIAGPFTSLTVLRNNDWSDAYLLWNSARQRSPDKLRVLYNYGIASAAHKRYEEADMAFSSVIKVGETKAEKKLFRADETVQVKCFHLSYANLANLQLRRYMRNRDAPDSSATLKSVDVIYRRGIERTAYDPDLTFTYARFLLELGRSSDAAQVLQTSLNMHQYADHLCFPLGLAYLETNNVAAARDCLTRALGFQQRHSLGVSWELPAARRSEITALLALSKLLLKQRVEAKNDLCASLELSPQGILYVLTTSGRVRNPKLKPVEVNPPDALIATLTTARRDLLELLLQSCDEVLNAHPEKEQTIIRMLRGVVDNELARRGAYQKKRAQFGFMDDPDAE